MTEENDKIVRDFLDLAVKSWNPENFTELLELFELENSLLLADWKDKNKVE